MGRAIRRDNAVVVEFENGAIQNESQRRHQLRPNPGQQDAGHNNHQRIEEVQRTVPTPGFVYDQANEDDVGEDLKRGLEAVLPPEREQQDVKERNTVPEQNRTDEEPNRKQSWSQLRYGQLNSEQEGQDEDTHLDQPGQPVALVEGGLHRDPSDAETSGRRQFISGDQISARPTKGGTR